MTQTAYGKVVCYIVHENVAYIDYLIMRELGYLIMQENGQKYLPRSTVNSMSGFKGH